MTPTPGNGQARFHLAEQRRIGTAAGGPYGLTRVTKAAIDFRGRIYVAQPLEHTVRVLDSTGRFIRYVGRRGAGPGEFQGLTNLGFVGDTLWVVDRRLGRVSYFSAEGDHLTTESVLAQPESDAFRPMPVDAVLSDGGGLALMGVPAGRLARGEVSRLPVVWVSRPGGTTRTIVEIDYSGAFYELRGGSGETGWTRTGPQPFVRPSLAAVAPDGSLAVIVAMDDPEGVRRGEVRIVAVRGSGQKALDRVVQFDPIALGRTVADSVLLLMEQRHRDGFRGRDPARGEIGAALREVVHRPSHVPPVDALLVSTDGDIWLRQNILGTTGAHTWFVLNPSLRRSRTVETPLGVEILAVGPDYVWAVHYDEFDVPYLLRYRLVEGRSGSVKR